MKLSDFLSDVGRPVAFYPGLRKITGATTATLFLCQLIYWFGKEQTKDGWLYKVSDDIEKETGLSYEEQKTARRHLVGKKLIEERYDRLNHIMYFRVSFDEINRAWDCHIPEQGNATFGSQAMPCSLKGITETTTENTNPPDLRLSPPPADLSIANSQHGRELLAQLKRSYDAKGRRPPSKYQTPQQMDAYLKAFETLNSGSDAMIVKAIEAGATSLDRILRYLQACAKRKLEDNRPAHQQPPADFGPDYHPPRPELDIVGGSLFKRPAKTEAAK